MTFGAIPVPTGVYLNSDTLVGKRLVSRALKTKPTVETEPRLWDQTERPVSLDVDVVCDRLASNLDQILDSIDEIRLSGDSSTHTVHRQIIAFAEFITTYLNGLTSLELNDIQTVGSKLLRLTEIAIDRIDGTVVSGPVDLNNKLSIPFTSMLFALIGTPLGLRRLRGGAAVGLGVSILIIFCYYVLWHGMTVLGFPWPPRPYWT